MSSSVLNTTEKVQQKQVFLINDVSIIYTACCGNRTVFMLSLDTGYIGLRPVERGGKGDVSPGPTTFGGPRRRSKIKKF